MILTAWWKQKDVNIKRHCKLGIKTCTASNAVPKTGNYHPTPNWWKSKNILTTKTCNPWFASSA
jgi:hypothetical protein